MICYSCNIKQKKLIVMVMQAYNPCNQEAEAGGLKAQGQAGLLHTVTLLKE